MLQSLLRTGESYCGQQTERCDSARVSPCALTHTGPSTMNQLHSQPRKGGAHQQCKKSTRHFSDYYVPSLPCASVCTCSTMCANLHPHPTARFLYFYAQGLATLLMSQLVMVKLTTPYTLKQFNQEECINKGLFIKSAKYQVTTIVK